MITTSEAVRVAHTNEMDLHDLLKGRDMEVNINQQCTVKLLRKGVEAIEKHYSDLGMDPPKKYKAGDEYCAPLWEIMNVFGAYTCMGPVPPFETTVTLKAL